MFSRAQSLSAEGVEKYKVGDASILLKAKLFEECGAYKLSPKGIGALAWGARQWNTEPMPGGHWNEVWD